MQTEKAVEVVVENASKFNKKGLLIAGAVALVVAGAVVVNRVRAAKAEQNEDAE